MQGRGAVDPMRKLESTAKDPRWMGGGDGMAQSRAASSDLAAPRERDQLLAIKVGIPRTRPDRLARAQLIQRLNRGMARELILVCTPAGFGKTTLLADWATSTNWAVAWLSLDRDDNDPARFWGYVVAALDRAREGLGEQLLPLLTAPTPLSGHGVATALIKQLEAQPDELALVLDDYHVIEAPAIHDSLAFLLRHLPPQLHLAISSRTDPEGCANAFMQLAGTHGADHRAGRGDAPGLAAPRRKRSVRRAGLALQAPAPGVDGARCSARRRREGLARDGSAQQ
jgi:hypothetical protein